MTIGRTEHKANFLCFINGREVHPLLAQTPIKKQLFPMLKTFLGIDPIKWIYNNLAIGIWTNFEEGSPEENFIYNSGLPMKQI